MNTFSASSFFLCATIIALAFSGVPEAKERKGSPAGSPIRIVKVDGVKTHQTQVIVQARVPGRGWLTTGDVAKLAKSGNTFRPGYSRLLGRMADAWGQGQKTSRPGRR